MSTLLLVLLTVLLAWPAPRLMARAGWLRRAPRAALVAWQSVTLSAIISALFAAPAILPLVLFDGQAVSQHLMILVVAITISGIMLVRLLLAGHGIGRRLRVSRRRHRELIDIIALRDPADARLRILEHPAPTAYCLPGRRPRVVVTKGAVLALAPSELAAVLSHEMAHLRGRHDLLVEFFSVIHETVPPGLRCAAAMREVRMLVEVLADRASVRQVGPSPTARALGVLAGGAGVPEAAMAAGADTAPARIDRLADQGWPVRLLSAGVYLYAATLLALPVAVFVVAWR